MITIEKLKKVLDEYDTDFILDTASYDRWDILEYHRNIIDELWLSFWIWELHNSEYETETIIYVRTNNDKVIHVLDEWLKEFNTLEEYCEWLSKMEKQALNINK